MKKLFEIWSQFWDSIYSLIRILLLSKKPNLKAIPKDLKSDCVILGNGPDLKIFLAGHQSFAIDKELICVNHFAETDAFTTLKPRFYILNAPEMWRDDVEEFHRKKGELMFKAIAENTNWPMILFIQNEAKNFKRWQSVISANANIHLVYFSPTAVEGFQSLRFWAYRNWKGLPRPHNVLIPSLIFAINLNFKNVYITGADHSWMKDITVGENNEVYLTQKHFYDAEKAQARGMDNAGKGSRRLHEILIKFYHAFAGYFDIRAYAKSRGTNIYNLTKGSFIDAFERKNLDA